MKTYQTYAPVFPGFYGTIFEESLDTAIDELEEENGENDSNAKEAMASIAHAIVYILNERLPRFVSLEFEEVYSPRYYNYSNDCINVTAKTTEAFATWYEEEKIKQSFKEFIRARCTSYDGFASFLSNDTASDDWQEITDDNVGLILEYTAQVLGITEEALYNYLRD